MKQNYKRPKIGAGDLKTPASFFEYVPKDGPDPGDVEEKLLFESMAQVYNPSMKDMEIMNAKGTKSAMTIKIRDPHHDYIPLNKHKVKLDDYRYLNTVWEIVDVSPDFENNAFIKIILGVTK